MERIRMIDRLIRIEVEPSLTTCISRSRIPGNIECLIPTARLLDEILLQGFHTEDMGNLEILKPAVVCSLPIVSFRDWMMPRRLASRSTPSRPIT